MRQAGARVEVHADHFADDAPDDVWLPVVGAHGWIVVTKDKAIRHRSNELEALKTARVAAFVLTAKGFTGAQTGAALAKAPSEARAVRDRQPAPLHRGRECQRQDHDALPGPSSASAEELMKRRAGVGCIGTRCDGKGVRPSESQCRVAVNACRRADRQVYAPRARGTSPSRPSGDSGRSGDTTEPL